MLISKRNCVLCGNTFPTMLPNRWTCSDECREEFRVQKERKAAEEVELTESQESAQFEFGTSEAEKARQALSGLNDPPEPGKALYRPESGLLELVQSAKVAAEMWDLPGSNEIRKQSAELALECIKGARAMLTPTVVAGGSDGNGPEVVRLADNVRADGEADDDEAAEAGAPDEREDPGGHPEEGLGPDPVVVQGDLGDPVPGDGLDDGPAA